MTRELTDLECEFLEETLREINGVGKATATRIIATQSTFSDFSDVTEEDISEIPRLDSEVKSAVVDKLNRIDFDQPVQVLYTKKILIDFLDNQYNKVRSLTLGELDINVLLIKALGFTTAEEVIEFYLYQRVTRSSVTSWGQTAIEEICVVVGAEEVPKDENVQVSGKRFDVKVEGDDETHYVQVKSGPNTMNIGMVDSLNKMIEKIEEKHENATGVLGMTYGERNQVSSQIRGNLNDFNEKGLIGQGFWELVTGDEEFYAELIELIDDLSKEYEERYERSYFDLIENKISQLADDWEDEYGAKGKEGLDAFVAEFTE